MRRILLIAGGSVAALALVLWWLLVPGTARPLDVPGDGRITSLEPLSSYTPLQGRLLMWLAGLDGVEPTNTVDTYRVTYTVPEARAGAQVQTGLLALPRGVAPMSLVSWQHGTTTSPDYVPSNMSIDGLATSILMAGRGHALVAADYQGLGGNQIRIHPYLVVEPTVASVLGLIDGARELPVLQDTDDILLAGFSQGGNASLATHRAIEARGGTVMGTLAIGAGVNLRQISVHEGLVGDSDNDRLYLAYIARGYCDYYGHAPYTVLTPFYAGRLESIFGAGLSPDEIIAALPENPGDLFNDAFMAAVEGRGDHWMWDILAENEPVDWAPRAPVLLLYGDADKDVAPSEAAMTQARMQARGATDVSVQSVGSFDHDGSSIAAIPYLLRWHEELLEE